jgi:hypothetical protein
LNLYERGAFENGALVFLAADTVNIRSTPAMANNIIDNLPVGYQMTVMQKAAATSAWDGLTAPWYLVRYTTPAGTRNGYVWGGFLSIAALPIRYAGKSALVLIVIKGAGANGRVPVQAMVVSDARIVSGISFDAIGLLSAAGTFEYTVSAELSGARGFNGISNVITLSFDYPACGFPFGAIVLLYDGKEIIYGTRAAGMIESGVFRSTSRYIFPDEKEGLANSLVCVETGEKYDDARKKYVAASTKRVIHVWEGKKFSNSR